MVWTMTFMETRRPGGGARRYRVWWRLGGSRYGEPQSETFDALADARTFKAAVEVAGHQWPQNYVPRRGWTQPEPDTTKPVEPVPFGDYALTYVHGLSGVAPRTRHDYERDLTRHLLRTFGHLDIRDSTAITPALVRQWVNALQTGEQNPADLATQQRRPLRPKTIQTCTGC
jgi:hypothetical protein